MNRIFYTDLKARGEAMQNDDGTKVFRYVSMWNNQLEKLRAGEGHGFDFPALLWEFIATEVDAVGNGVQVFDPVKVRAHVIDKLFDSNGDKEVNLNALDLGDKVYAKFQLYQTISDFAGSSPFNRTAVELDNDHDNLYHHVTEFTTTWTDNSQTLPIGGSFIEPPLLAEITIVRHGTDS